MTKVFQTIIDRGKGNCMQAVVASLFDLKLEQVPNFIELPLDSWWEEFERIFEENGHKDISVCVVKDNLNAAKSIMNIDGGINGYYYGVINSRTYDGVLHAVVVDSDLKVVHDPNPNQLCLGLEEENILQIYVKEESINKYYKLNETN